MKTTYVRRGTQGRWITDWRVFVRGAYLWCELWARRRVSPGVDLSIKPFTTNMNAKYMHMVAWILIIVGALNWLLVGVGGFAGANWNLVTLILGSWPAVESIVYILVGLAGVYEIVTHKKSCMMCSGN